MRNPSDKGRNTSMSLFSIIKFFSVYVSSNSPRTSIWNGIATRWGCKSPRIKVKNGNSVIPPGTTRDGSQKYETLGVVRAWKMLTPLDISIHNGAKTPKLPMNRTKITAISPPVFFLHRFAAIPKTALPSNAA